MALPFTEDFDAGAGVLANPPWTQAALAAQTLNYDGAGAGKASAANAASDVFAYDNSNAYNSDQWAQVTIKAGIAAGTHFAEVCVSCSGSGGSFQGYSFNTDGTTGALHTVISKWSAGSPTDIANFATTFAAGDVMRLERRGNVLTAYKNGVRLGSVTDGTPLTGGAPGCGVFNDTTNTVTLDNFAANNLADAGSWPSSDFWRPPGPPGPRDPRGFLIAPARSYVETPPPPPPPTVVPRPPVIVSKPKRRKRTVQTTTLAAQASQLTTAPPRSPITVAKTKPRKRKARALVVRGSPRAAAAPTSVRPAKPITVAQAKKRRTRKPKVSLVRAPRATPVVATPPKRSITVTTPKKRRRRLGAVSLLVAPLDATVTAPSAPPRKPATTATPRKRKKRQGAVVQLAARVARVATGKPPKQTVVLVEKRRAGKNRKTTLVRGAPRAGAAPAAAPSRQPIIAGKQRKRKRQGSVTLLVAPLDATVTPSTGARPSKTITVKLAPKRRKKGGAAKVTRLKKPRTPYITGVTRNSAGTPIGSCNVFVFRTANDTLVAQGVSDSVTGIYLLPVPSYTDNLFVVAYRADAPDIFGTTVNWLTGV